MSDAAKNEQANEALAAIGQIMADMGEGEGETAPAPEASENEAAAAPILDLTRRVNADGTVTDLTTPGANSEDRVQSAFASLRDAVADQGLEGLAASKSADPALEAEATPHIKAWLDEHLPAIVERVVREEVERLARRG